MTTIAIKDGIIAYDSRLTRQGLIVDDDAEKKYEKNGVVFFMVGSVCDYQKLIDLFFDPEKETPDLEASAFVIKKGELFTIGVDENRGFWKSPGNITKPDAMGSGGEHAITAMDCGLTAVEAVEMAKKRDTCTGGRVRKYVVEKSKT